MPLMINTNVASLNSQRQLLHSGNDLDQAMERLSSGRRVNNAADDAAGLAISNRMTSQIRGLNQAVRNANDGISMIQTAEGALDETTNILQRMRELSIQAANGIYSDADRSTLDAEVQQLKLELDRIAESTTFNGQPLLDGSLGDVTLQVGSEEGDTIDLNITAFDTDSLGGGLGGDIIGAEMDIAVSAAADLIGGGNSTGTLAINGQSVGDLTNADNLSELLDTINGAISGVEVTSFVEINASIAGDGVLRGAATLNLALEDLNGNTQSYVIAETGSLAEVADRINEVTAGTIDASIDEDGLLQLSTNVADNIAVSYGTGASADNVGIAATTHRAQLSFEITDSTITDIDITIGASNSTGELPANKLAIAEAFGIQTRKDGDITGNTVLSANTGDITEGHLVINGVALTAISDGTTGSAHGDNLVAAINAKSDLHGVVATNTAATGSGTLSLNSVDGSEISIEFAGSTATTDTTGLIETNVSSVAGDSVADIQIVTVEGATEALDIIDVALETINDTRADLGAVNNRLDFTISNLANVVENTEAARSRILDADFAAETAALSRAQVLQQASQAILAQANARPQEVLQLLQ